MAYLCNLQIHVNAQHTFFLHQKILSRYSGTLRKLIKQERKTGQAKNLAFTLHDFPGGPSGFELISQFCYNNGHISISISNVAPLYCAAIYLGMARNHSASSNNLLHQSETFLQGMFHWSWGDVLICLQTCEPFFHYADSCGLIDKLITALLAKIAQNSDISLISSSNSSSISTSPEHIPSNDRSRKPLSSSSTNNSNPNNNNNNNSSSSNKAWWFEDLSRLCPMTIEKVIRSLGAYGSDNTSLLLTKFLLHYLNTSPKSKKNTSICSKSDYTGLADTAIYGVNYMGKAAFSCRALFWVLRLISGFSLSKVCRNGLEKLIGSMVDMAKLDDLLVSGNNIDKQGSVYDVNLVVRLIRVFVECEGISIERLKKVGWLIDHYLAEISPDQNLKISNFIGVAQSLPDLARDCFDGVYRAIDIYLESHPNLSLEERSRICRCLNYEKLSLEACKELAKNPRIPPRVAVQALASQKHVNYDPPTTHSDQLDYYCEITPININTKSNKLNQIGQYYCDHIISPTKTMTKTKHQIVLYGKHVLNSPRVNEEGQAEEEDYREETSSLSEGISQDLRLNIQRMQWRVSELEQLCKDMKTQMTRLVRHTNKSTCYSPTYNNKPPRLC